MSKSSDALTSLLANWDQLKKQRPTESDFTPHGYPLVNYETMDELFARWNATLNILDEKGYWSTSPEMAVADAPLATIINDLSGLINSARNNGISWMLSSRFLDVSNNIQQQLSALTRRQTSVNKEMAKLLAARSAESADVITKAARSAKQIIDLGKVAEENAARITATTMSLESTNTLVDSINSDLAMLAKAASENASTVSNEKEAVTRLMNEINTQKQQALVREIELTNRAASLDKQINDIQNKTTAAYESVTKALRAARNQGLAASFQDRSTTLRTERFIWVAIFLLAVSGLITLAIHFSTAMDVFTYEALIVNLLRKIGLAAPVVWIGWYSARQVGRISRVQEDYEYKAASALAFLSYKDEAKLGGDEEMHKKLLGHAINTFGENPVRLYEDHANDPVSPIQAAIKELPPEKIAQILAAVGEQTIKSKFWPFGSGK